MLSRTLRHVVLLWLAAVVLFPFIWMVLTSLKPPEEIYVDHIRWLPDRLYWLENYTTAFTKAPLARYLLNGVIVTLAIFLLQVFVNLPAAYALSKLRWKGREFVFGLVLACLLIPPHAVAIPVFLLLHQLHWVGGTGLDTALMLSLLFYAVALLLASGWNKHFGLGPAERVYRAFGG